jgi:cytochrome c-type biogenesis protein CcmF
MSGYIGQSLLSFALLSAFLGSCIPAFKKRHLSLLHGTVGLISLAFVWLIYSHLTDDFSLLNVYLHSHTEKPFLYKIAGTWGNHEGSMLLWVFLLSLSFSFAARQVNHPVFTTTSQLTLLAFLSFIILTSDPFAIHITLTEQGRDLNPLLQDPLLAIHPPFLYLGYVSFAIPFSLAVYSGVTHQAYLPLMRVWSLAGWTFLTIGIILGSFWAYYELGWGGWWFWDPVENAALIPWLSATIQLHLLMLCQRRSSYLKAGMISVVVTWASCLGGIIFVRSGLLTSVHSFAIAPERGIVLSMICAVILIFGLVFMKPLWRSQPSFLPKTRLFFLLEIGCGFLAIGWFTVVLGTIYPLLIELFGVPMTVGATYFHLTFIPLMLPVLVLMALAPDILLSTQRSLLPLTLSGFILVGCYWGLSIHHLSSLFAIFGASWVIMATFRSGFEQKRVTPMMLSHLGFGIGIVGMVCSIHFANDQLLVIQKGVPFSFLSYQLDLKDVVQVDEATYTAQQAWIDVHQNAHYLTTLKPEKRFYHTQKIIHGETALYHHGWHHLYLTLGEAYQGDQWSIRIYFKPWINFMWLGGILMAFGGVWALLRRFVRLEKKVPVAIAASLIFLVSLPVAALEAHEQLSDPRLEQLAKELGDELLCPTCAGQILNDSSSATAETLRREIRQYVKDGKTKDQIIALFQKRYGPQIYRHPSFSFSSALLWGLPWIAAIALSIIGYRRYRQEGIS